MNKAELLELVDNLNLPKEEYCILSGGALVLNGISETTEDLDLGLTDISFEILTQKYTPIPTGKFENHYSLTDNIECLFIKDYKIKVEYVDGYPCESLECILEYKQSLNREKDKKDIIKIKKFLHEREER